MIKNVQYLSTSFIFNQYIRTSPADVDCIAKNDAATCSQNRWSKNIWSTPNEGQSIFHKVEKWITAKKSKIINFQAGGVKYAYTGESLIDS